MKDKISNYFELRRMFWTSFLLTFGGSVTLLLTPYQSILKIIFVCSGILASALLFSSVVSYNDKINKSINSED